MNPSAPAEDVAAQQLRQACAELERCLRAGDPCQAEDLLTAFPAVASHADSALELIYTEFVVRQQLGQQPSTADWCARFPQWRDDLEQVFQVHAALANHTTSDPNTPAAGVGRQEASRSVGESGGPTDGPRRVGPYELLEEIGRGGMGVVYKARCVHLNRVVALKMILAGEDAGPEERGRFRTEAKAVAGLQHPHIVQIFEVGEWRTGDGRGPSPCLALEYVDGGNLQRKLAECPPPPREAARLVELLARAVHYAHEHGVLHRDLKPANVLLTADGTPKITDFGLAKRLGLCDAGGDQTRTGAVLGTPSYMAPEQAGGRTREIGPACDAYALGAILYECLTGLPPFRAPSPLETLQHVVKDEPAPPRRLQSRIPADVETICLKCLEKQPGRRYGTARELAEELRRFQAGEPIRARPVRPLERLAKWARRRPARAAAYGLLAAALVLGVGGGGATWLWRRAENARADSEKARDDLSGALRREQTARGDAEAAQRRAVTAEDEAKTAKRQLTQYAYADRVNLAQREWDGGQVNRARELLDDAGALQEELTPGSRPWEWNFLHRVFHPELVVLEGHKGRVNSVCFSPDGRRLATACSDQTVRLWDADSGKQIAVLKGHTSWVCSVCFSPDGGRLATASQDGTARLWDADSGQSRAVLQVPSGHVQSVCFSPDGRRVATASRDSARLWDVDSGKQIAILNGHTSGISSVCFSPDGGRLATASCDNTARLWNAESRQSFAVLQGHTGFVSFVCFSPDGGRVATASCDGTARLWDAASGKQIALLQGHTGGVVSVAFSPDGGRVATASMDGTARLWIARESQEDQDKRLREQHRLWQEQQAADAEKGGCWFAARFHLNRLLLNDPNNAALLHRRDAAEARLKAP